MTRKWDHGPIFGAEHRNQIPIDTNNFCWTSMLTIYLFFFHSFFFWGVGPTVFAVAYIPLITIQI